MPLPVLILFLIIGKLTGRGGPLYHQVVAHIERGHLWLMRLHGRLKRLSYGAGGEEARGEGLGKFSRRKAKGHGVKSAGKTPNAGGEK